VQTILSCLHGERFCFGLTAHVSQSTIMKVEVVAIQSQVLQRTLSVLPRAMPILRNNGTVSPGGPCSDSNPACPRSVVVGSGLTKSK
jgi:hypothetical protein